MNNTNNNSVKKLKVVKKRKIKNQKKKVNEQANNEEEKEELKLLIRVESRPNILLQYLYFLNECGTKHVAVGFLPEEDFRVYILLSSNLSHVRISITDWLALLHLEAVGSIEKWFSNDEDNLLLLSFLNDGNQAVVETEGEENETMLIMQTKNIKVSKLIVNERRLIQIENIPQNRVNSLLFLTKEEYKQCQLLDTYFQPLIKQMQANSSLIEDYYELYVYYCINKKKCILNDDEYFVPTGTAITFDIYRIFKEIPVICKDRLFKDLSIFGLNKVEV